MTRLAAGTVHALDALGVVLLVLAGWLTAPALGYLLAGVAALGTAALASPSTGSTGSTNDGRS